MCGVCGVVGDSGRRAGGLNLVVGMNAAQRHRGPDGDATWAGPGAVLGHTRLAVVDLSDGGRQPFVSTDGTVAVVFNGEIYNHGELRRRYALTTAEECDGAILPELWARLGTEMFGHLRGMYAIAVHDARQATTTLARDPFGIKPLYWSSTGHGLAFASECRSLLPLHPDAALRADALHRFVAFGAIGADASPFTGISAVPANGWIQWGADRTVRRGVARPDLLTDLPPTTPAELRAAFLDSVAHHLGSDVPVALLLSAGLDSAALAWAGRELGTELVCVTVDQDGVMGESSRAARWADELSHPHVCVTTRPDLADVRHYLAAMQRPSIDGLNTFVVSRAVAGIGLKVALSGLGGDEILAGYPVFRMLRALPLLRAADRLRLSRLLAGLAPADRRKLALLAGPGGPRDAAGLGTLARRLTAEPELRRLLPWAGPTVPAESTGDRSALALSRYEIRNYLGAVLLPDGDAFSMACSVELRVPFVDVPFARRALALDPRRGVGKRGFAACLDDRGLRRVAARRKQGFTLPMDRWMRSGPLAPVVRAAAAPDAPVREVLDRAGVDAVLAGWRTGALPWTRAWQVAVLDGWLRTLDTSVVRLRHDPADSPLVVA